jgi:hypothetical protein
LDELSHIQNRQNLDWIPQDSALARVAFANGSILYVQEAPGLVAYNGETGFYFVAFVQGDTIDFTAKPIHASFVEYQIKNWLPGAATRNCEVYDLPWEYSTQSDPNFVCKIINSLMKDCDQLKDKELTAT